LVFIVVFSHLHFTSIFIRNICYGSLVYPFFCELLVKYCDGNRLMYGKWILKYLWWIRRWYILYFPCNKICGSLFNSTRNFKTKAAECIY
jgi:hypothetical protein